MATASKNAWKCPECGLRSGISMLLCPCGYHRPTERKLDPEELENGGPLPTRPTSTDVTVEPVWLPRAATLARVLAWVSGVAGIFYAIAIAGGSVPSGSSGSSANGVGSAAVVPAIASLVGGAIAFVVYQAVAEAIEVLLRLDRDATARRR